MSEQQPNPAEFSSFADWCLHKKSLSPEARHTVEMLLNYAGTSDINEANRILSSRKKKKLSLGNNQISDLTPLQSLTNVTKLNLDNNQISDLTPLQFLTNLTKLSMCNNQISDLTPLQSLTNLTRLYLYRNQISDITPLQSLTHLTELNLDNNQISDITPLQSLTHLTELNLSYNQISDITLLQSLTHLAHLDLMGNQISDITSLQSLKNLTYLNLDSNRISDIILLQSLTNLTSLYVNFTPEQKALIEAYENSWGTLAHSTEPISYRKAAAALKAGYELLGVEAPEITFCSGPHSALVQLPMLKKSNNNDLIDRLKKQVKDPLLPLTFTTEFQQLSSSYFLRWEEQLKQQLRADFSNYKNHLMSIVNPRYAVDAVTVAEFCVSALGIVLKPEAQKALECLKQILVECGWILTFENVCYVCDRPTKLSLDSEYRLHAEGESAIAFSDGYKLYSYHGVTLPEKYGQIHPNQWEATWILEEENAELRRVLIQGIGYDRICQELQATDLDTWQEYTLLRIDADIDGFDTDEKEPIYLLKMTCPSTGFIHALRVPPDIQSAREAIRWVNWDVDYEEFSVQT
ncbi:MAG: leucine-rich repeat domain-containing protein [Microcoleus sp. PH2017_40_RAT_O_B]|jgi:internalin A|uniref:leucine-rich repeat domain-containing protein n=1 Tax=unclassified Microcoleus TaxID=2642155 RepID=UPI001D53269A|nr:MULTISPECIES: leucine-rich repeat domain-containing protein [unclassified Microcoleus]MCC3429472.1 leucine-rich repeat domain-containing protein [Microcoleus sp. PH2017_04_SCI_O_A]TAF90675.1 MAG: leucine-rich repeat domain-containing protein [Oscillatoriales cyanobacterium]MCC3449389.1 leucine-rich repeat domain-containing protein [Microcoleus sp. PH2017_09_SFU_O_A]MCC3564694.1 leucine-rich repeat domain-containing protein [Microcoleus sp. PH2017_31_RDM_U_A]MCC3570628.1 leucine-rich repeat 